MTAAGGANRPEAERAAEMADSTCVVPLLCKSTNEPNSANERMTPVFFLSIVPFTGILHIHEATLASVHFSCSVSFSEFAFKRKARFGDAEGILVILLFALASPLSVSFSLLFRICSFIVIKWRYVHSFRRTAHMTDRICATVKR